MASDCLMRWKLIIEEYCPKMYYIPGPENIVAEVMSRIPMTDDDVKVKQLYTCKLSTTRRSYAHTGDITEEYPLDVAVISYHQKTECFQLRKYVSNEKSPYTEAKLHGESVIVYKDELYIPKALQRRVVNWYHWFLCHHGSTRLAKTIQHACSWPKLVTQAKRTV